ncbi:type VI secretion system tube protein TssD [Pseudomonas sp. UFMG81]|uniref:type VI secretion system tube protein TssD n=1 Tax=Pseudomonas sp. UFMG81 TaxID=2745936 RepID=UPI00188E5A83|nr:type VI secretion system tube protein TssD [Pseudomonas sp. UFMG81]
MATPAYMAVTGEKQGLITAGAFTADSVGNTYQEGHEDQVMVQGFEHEVIIPRDPQSGQPTGQRVHKPVKITKVFRHRRKTRSDHRWRIHRRLGGQHLPGRPRRPGDGPGLRTRSDHPA